MTNPVFPTLAKDQDSKFYEIMQEDSGMVTKMEGGYVVSRAKHTRAPRKTFKTGYSSILNADRVLLMNFYATVRGSSVVFNWTDPIENVVYAVRFASQPVFKYVGMGVAQLWDVSFQLEQA